MSELPDDFLRLLETVTSKRPRTVIDHILKHGYITTEELKEIYGYNHPPRAARDVREAGIPLKTFRVVGSDGRKLAAYKFGDPNKARPKRVKGRTALPSKLKRSLVDSHGSKCFIYLEPMDVGELQIDHRIPYEVVGEQVEPHPDDFMLLSPAANRAKSWSCEHCANWLQQKDPELCRSCYWAYPESYAHVAMEPVRRLDLVWRREDISQYDTISQDASALDTPLAAYVKGLVRRALRHKR